MINHVRTVLMNMPGPSQPRLDTIYDAYVPEYTPVVLPPALWRIRKALYGTAPDYQGACMRTAQLLALVAGTPYASHLTHKDPRITYDFSSQTAHRLPEVFATVTGETCPDAIRVSGTFSPDVGTGRSVATWAIRWEDGAGTVTSTETPQTQVEAGLSVPLPGSGLVVTTPTLPENETWRISHRSMVGGLVAAVDSVLESESDIRALFPAAMSEPMSTYYALTSHAMFPYRATGVVLALATQMEALRDGV